LLTYSYITASGILELITKKCLKVREPIENQQGLLLPLLAMMGLLTKIAEICPKSKLFKLENHVLFYDSNYYYSFIPSTDKVDLLSLVKSTEIFGTITLLYRTMSFGE